MIKHGYPELFAEDTIWLPRARALAERTYEFSEFLVDYLRVEDVGARFSGKIAYHSSCHLLRDLGIDRQPRALLAAVKEAEFVVRYAKQENLFYREKRRSGGCLLRRRLPDQHKWRAA